jgi:DNA-directed RNA polymerase subunit RPC12/RpoP
MGFFSRTPSDPDLNSTVGGVMLGVSAVFLEDYSKFMRALGATAESLGKNFPAVFAGYLAFLVTAIEKVAEAKQVRSHHELIERIDGETVRWMTGIAGKGISAKLTAHTLRKAYRTLREELRRHTHPAADPDNLAGTLTFEFMGFSAYSAGRWDDLETVGPELFGVLNTSVDRLLIEQALVLLIPPTPTRPASTPPRVEHPCGRCGQRLALPANRGRLRVTCPRCGAKEEVTT